VDEKEIKEWKETFDHFDQDHSQSLDYKEFKSCLRAIGYDLTFAEDGAKDEQFDAIVSIVDPNHDGQIKWDEFLAFMILKSTTKVESSEGIADALQMISEGKPYVTTEQLRYYRYKRMYLFFYFILFRRAVLSPSQVEYCEKVLKPIEGTTNQYSIAEFTAMVHYLVLKSSYSCASPLGLFG